jgi:ABC-type amino acid transport substrate-binding protein
MIKRIVFCLFFVLLASQVCSKEYVVGVKPTPPFINISANNEVTGFSIDLLDQLMLIMEPTAKVRYHIDPDMKSHLQSVVQGKVDFGIAATTITAEREKILDFTQPFYKADLAILVPRSDTQRWAFVDIFMSKELLITLFGIFIYVVLISHLIWLVERSGEESHFSGIYSEGIVQALWWTVVTISTVGYGDFHLKRPIGRFLGVFVIFSGIMLFGVAIASLTSALTVQQLKPTITGPKDLPGHTIAVIENTFTAKATENMGVYQKTIRTLYEGLVALDSRKVDAVVHDRPLLQYLIKDFTDQRFLIVDKGFAPSTYGITLPQESKLTEKLNIALLKLLEGGKDSLYNDIHKKWFGE